MTVDRAGGPLAGLLVADFSRILAGPYATMLLADMGAEVVKVEGPGGDDTRTWQPPVRDGISTYYLGVNRNKRSIALDLRDAGDLAAARELARRADVFIENFKPGGLARFGLDYEATSAANPAVVYASISGFGSGPEGAALPGYDLIVQAISGLMSVTGDPDGEPYRAGVAVFDVISGLHATIGILAALNHRHETGQGQHVEISLLASAMSGLVNQTSAYVAGGVVPFRMGNSHPSLFPYEPLPCADGELIITAGNDLQFRKLAQVLGVPELPDDPRFGRNEDRTANRDQLRPLLVERLRTRTKMEWFRELIAAGVACGPINTIDQGVAFATEVGLDPVVTRGPGRRRDAVGAPPDHLLRDPGQLPAAAACPGRARRRDPPLAGRTRRIEAERNGFKRQPRPQRGGGRMSGGTDGLSFPTSLGTSTADQIRLLGQDLTADLMGQVSFGELAFWLVALRRPTPSETRVFEAVLVALADHGFTPTAIAARLTYLSAPDSLQGALAAGLLGGGSRFLGVTEDCGRYLHEVLERRWRGVLPSTDEGWDALALAAVRETRAAGRFVPGLGHPVHKVTDPRTPVLIQIAEQEGLRGPHLRLFEAIGRVHEQVLGRRLPLNGAGVCGAALADLGLPVELLRGFALLARAAGLLGQIAEERRRPVGMDVYMTVDRNAVYVNPDEP